MKFRLGLVLMGVFSLVVLKLVSVGFGWINLPSDTAVLAGIGLLGGLCVFAPVIYHLIYKKTMKHNAIDKLLKEINDEE